MKIKRKVIFFVALLSLFYCISIMQDTYAKYVTTANAVADFAIARWNIKINNQDVISNSNFSTTITPSFEGTSYIAPGVVAPTSTGSFSVTLDASGTDVSLDYTITIENNDENVTDLRVTGYEQIDIKTINAFTGSVSGSILQNIPSKKVTYIFYVEWNDDHLTEFMDNEDDTAAAGGTATLDVTVNLIQKH